MLNPLFYIPPDSEQDWKSWMLDHSLQHDIIYSALVSLQQSVIKFPLTDSREKNDKDWLNNHQLEHEAIYSALQLVSMPDLTSFDLDNPDNFEIWQELHQDVHNNINATLGI